MKSKLLNYTNTNTTNNVSKRIIGTDHNSSGVALDHNEYSPNSN